uniref:Plant intracellular Ras-group-related LRR protein 3-like n=1 Tax=Sinocyclocheilus grahami TaxID=75366 RepID=A0A672NFW3_SINGR
MNGDDMVLECLNKQQESLNMSHRGLVVLPPGVSRLITLKKLFLNNNKLILPPDEVSHILKTSHIIYNNAYTSLFTILHLEKLEELTLDRNQLTILPGNIGSLKHLTYLGVNHNPLSVLPEAIGDLRQLRELWAVGCGLVSIPSSIGKLGMLEKLGLHNNKITHLPLQFGGLSNLQWLNLADNKLQDLPEDVNHLQSLVFMNLDKNCFTNIPTALTDMANLQILSVKFNSIRSLEDYLIPGFSRLIKLDLRENPFMDRPPHWKVINQTATQVFKYTTLMILPLLFSVTCHITSVHIQGLDFILLGKV